MVETLKDVGHHVGPFGDGHYEATVNPDGGVELTIVYDTPKTQKPTINLSHAEWDRLTAWVAWAGTDWKEKK